MLGFVIYNLNSLIKHDSCSIAHHLNQSLNFISACGHTKRQQLHTILREIKFLTHKHFFLEILCNCETQTLFLIFCHYLPLFQEPIHFFVDIRNVVDIRNEISDSCNIASYSFHIIAKFYLEVNYEQINNFYVFI